MPSNNKKILMVKPHHLLCKSLSKDLSLENLHKITKNIKTEKEKKKMWRYGKTFFHPLIF